MGSNPTSSASDLIKRELSLRMNRVGNALHRIINSIQGLPMPDRMRLPILRAAGVTIGSNVGIFGGSLFLGDCKIGDGSFINTRCILDGYGTITIGRNVHLATGVKIITSTHEIGPMDKRAGPRVVKAVVVGDGCWLCTDSQILPGVTVAPGCVVASGAIVTKDTVSNGLYAGVPARRIRDLSP